MACQALGLYLAVHNIWAQLRPDDFLAIAIQACILSFAVWAYARGYLKH
jgi:hypothetical protein